MKPYLFFKQTADFFFAALLIVILSPVLFIISAIIKLDSKGPVLFKQKRIGKSNIEFDIYKFRTMRTDTPKDVPTHMFRDAESYITAIGKFLRKSSLDELPQLFNIIQGKMSFIGPRPALWNQFDLIKARNALGVETLKPGITGWAQVNGRDELPIKVKAELDGFYKDHCSLIFDIKILFLTFINVISQRGVVEGGPDKKKKQS